MFSFIAHRRYLVTLAGVLCSGCGEQPAQLDVPDRIDFGVVSPETAPLEVPLKNAGGETLRILETEPSCSCISVRDVGQIRPGSTAKLLIDGPRGGPGPGDATITIRSNDPRGPRVVYLRWLIPFSAYAIPQRIDVQAEHRTTDLISRPLRIIVAGRPDDVSVVQAEASDPRVRLVQTSDPTEANEPGETSPESVSELLFRVDVSPPSAGREVRAECRFQVLSGSNLSELIIPVRVSTPRAIEALPGRLVWAAATAAELVSQRRQVRVSVQNPETPRIVESPEFVKCELLRRGPGEYSLIVEITAAPDVPDSAIVLRGDTEGSQAEVALEFHILGPGAVPNAV